jgi:hypothetical protein
MVFLRSPKVRSAIRAFGKRYSFVDTNQKTTYGDVSKSLASFNGRGLCKSLQDNPKRVIASPLLCLASIGGIYYFY